MNENDYSEKVNFTNDLYTIEEGRFVLYKHKKPFEGIWEHIKINVTENFFIKIHDYVEFSCSDVNPRWVGTIITRDRGEFPFIVEIIEFSDTPKIAKFLLRSAGSSARFDNSTLKYLKTAIQKTNNDICYQKCSDLDEFVRQYSRAV
jgi:hypothetical protein